MNKNWYFIKSREADGFGHSCTRVFRKFLMEWMNTTCFSSGNIAY